MAVKETVKLEYRMEKGEEIRYKTTIESVQVFREGEEMHDTRSYLEMIMVQRCTDVTADNVMSMEVVIESGSLFKDGQEEPLPNVGQVISVKMKKNGEISLVHPQQMPFTQPPFPEGALAKKAKWTGDSQVTVPGRPEPVALNYNYILWDFVSMDGHDCAEIKISCPQSTIELAEGVQQVLSATGTSYFAHKKGMLIKSQVETKTDITSPEATIGTHLKVAVELV